MGFKTITGIQWTNLELRGLLEDEDSCVYLEKVQKHLGLHPFHLTNLNEALREILNASLNFYDSELNGLLLAYKNPKILSPFGDILYDTCFVHIDIEADFYVFKPEIGRSLKGFVNKKGTKHIGILVHKAFNVSLPKPDDAENEEDWPGNKVKVGQEIRFTLDKIDYTTRLPYIRGSLNKEEYLNGCQPFDEQIASTYESEYNKSNNGNIKEECRAVKNKSKMKNKKIVFNYSDTEVDLVSDSEKKSAKKLKQEFHYIEEPIKISPKKRKRKSSSICELESELLEQKRKKRKKRLDTENEEQNEFLMENLKSVESNIKSEEGISKVHSTKRKRNSITKDTLNNREDEENKLFQNSSDKLIENSESNMQLYPISSKKRKKKRERSEENDIDEERINKKPSSYNLSDNLDSIDLNNLKCKDSNKQSKIKKINHSVTNDVEDERMYKKSLKKNMLDNIESNQSNTIECKILNKPLKKKKRTNDKIPVDTEDGETLKKYVNNVNNLSNNLDINKCNNVEFTEKKKQSKKKKISLENDDKLMDTEDKRMHKSSIKSFVQLETTDNIENSSEFKESKQKKHKKKHKSSELIE